MKLDLDALEQEYTPKRHDIGDDRVVALIQRLREAEAGWDGLHVASNEAIDKLEHSNDALIQLLHSWRFLWNEGDLTFEEGTYNQATFDDLLRRTHIALNTD